MDLRDGETCWDCLSYIQESRSSNILQPAKRHYTLNPKLQTLKGLGTL